jgi:hypothetical protein
LDHGNAGRQFRAYCAAVGDTAGKIGPVFNKDSVLVGSDKAAVLDAAGKRDRIDVDTGRKVENRAAVANAAGETRGAANDNPNGISGAADLRDDTAVGDAAGEAAVVDNLNAESEGLALRPDRAAVDDAATGARRAESREADDFDPFCLSEDQAAVAYCASEIRSCSGENDTCARRGRTQVGENDAGVRYRAGKRPASGDDLYARRCLDDAAGRIDDAFYSRRIFDVDAEGGGVDDAGVGDRSVDRRGLGEMPTLPPLITPELPMFPVKLVLVAEIPLVVPVFVYGKGPV